jgi:hypothetical protein
MAWTAYQASPSTGAEHFFNLKTALVAAGWVVKASGTGSAGAGSGTYNATGDAVTTAALMANTNAWFRIQDPTTTREFTFQRTSANTTWRIKYSASAKFTGGSPSASQTPSATDEIMKIGQGTDASPTGVSCLPTDATYRQKYCVGGSSETYGFWCGGWTISTFANPFLLVHDPVQQASAVDADQFVFLWATTFTPTSHVNSTNATGSTAGVTGWLSSSRTPSGHTAIPGMFFTDGTTTIPAASSANVFDLTEDLFAIPFIRRGALTAPTGYKGWSSMMRWCSTSRAVGTTFQSGSYLVIGTAFALPWNVAQISIVA